MITIGKLLIVKDSGYVTLTAVCTIGDTKHDLWYKTTVSINPTLDIFLIACIIPAMVLGQDITVEGNVSKKLHDCLEELQNKYILKHSHLKKVQVHATLDTKELFKLSNHVGCFFTGGVDSFYTLLTHADEINTLIYVNGFDAWLHEVDYLCQASRKIKTVAEKLGKEFIGVWTNIHTFSDAFADWGELYHGSALASVGMLLSVSMDKIYIASSYDHQQNKILKWGSHPDLDNLWSTDYLEIVHDGCEFSRIEKVARIAKEEICFDCLRVCNTRTNGQYNCSECEKCVRTMISLSCYGVLDKYTTFQLKDTLSNLARKIKIHSKGEYLFAIENLEKLGDEMVKESLREALLKYRQAL